MGTAGGDSAWWTGPSEEGGRAGRRDWRDGVTVPSPPPPRPEGLPLLDSAGEAPVALCRLLAGVHEELRAYLFLFVEVSCLSSSAACCRELCGGLWTDGAFWRAYGGPCLRGLQPATSAGSLRDAFRRWLFRLEDGWARDFQDFCDEARSAEFGADYVQVLCDARYLASGLMPRDSAAAVQEFSELLATLLSEYSASQLDERDAAEQLLLQVESRSDVFTDAQIRSAAHSYEQHVERALLDQGLEDRSYNLDAPPNPLAEDSQSEAGSLPDDGLGWEPPFAPPPLGDEDEAYLPASAGGDDEGVSFWRG